MGKTMFMEINKTIWNNKIEESDDSPIFENLNKYVTKNNHEYAFLSIILEIIMLAVMYVAILTIAKAPVATRFKV